MYWKCNIHSLMLISCHNNARNISISSAKKGTQYKELPKCRSDHKVFNSTPTSETYHQQKNPGKNGPKKERPKRSLFKMVSLCGALYAMYSIMVFHQRWPVELC